MTTDEHARLAARTDDALRLLRERWQGRDEGDAVAAVHEELGVLRRAVDQQATASCGVCRLGSRVLHIDERCIEHGDHPVEAEQ